MQSHGRLVIFPKLEIFSKLMGAEEGDRSWRWTLSSWYSTGNVQIPKNDLWGLQAHGPLDGLRKKDLLPLMGHSPSRESLDPVDPGNRGS